MSGGPIPFTAIIEFATIYNVEDLNEFFYYMRRLDATYLEFSEKKNDNKDTN